MVADYNLEKEYGWFLDGVLKYVESNPDDFLEHYGVKGMHWGVRKGGQSSQLTNLGPNKIVRTTASGEEITLEKNPPMAIHKALAKMSKRYREDYANFAALSIKDSSGKSIGTAQVHKKSSDELNLVWMSVDKSARGKGYATATMHAAEEFGRQSGFKKLTLEVPGNAPDARHIYEKMGFKVTKEADDANDDSVWGGLTEMEYRIGEVKHIGTELKPFLAHLSEAPWSNYSAADYTVEQWHRACLIHQHQGPPTNKNQCKLPVRTPDGTVNRNGVHAAAAALAGARGGVHASISQIAQAKAALKRLYSQLNEEAPSSMAQSGTITSIDVDEFLEHYGVKGMHWGVRRAHGSGSTGPGRSAAKAPTERQQKRKDRKIKRTEKRLNIAKHNHEVRQKNVKVIQAHLDDMHKNGVNSVVMKAKYGHDLTLGNSLFKYKRGKTIKEAFNETRNDLEEQRDFEKALQSRHADQIKSRSKRLNRLKHSALDDVEEEPNDDLDDDLDLDDDDPDEGDEDEAVDFNLEGFLAQSEIDNAEEIISHYGVRGMHWGTRRSRAQIDSDSEDVRRVKTAKGRIKSNRTTDVLSNKELQDVVTRMNLEQQYSRLTKPSKDTFTSRMLGNGQKIATNMLIDYGQDKAIGMLEKQNPAAGIMLRKVVEANKKKK
jgi:ribosomal protein S18 acetylase RimI-like enzyme